MRSPGYFAPLLLEDERMRQPVLESDTLHHTICYDDVVNDTGDEVAEYIGIYGQSQSFVVDVVPVGKLLTDDELARLDNEQVV